MKATATWHATETIQTCRECCGGAGYMSVNRFAALKADTDVFTTFEGDNTVLMMLLAKGLLTGYQADFGELNPVETVTFIAGQAVETVIERLFARKIVQVIGDAGRTGERRPGDLLDARAPAGAAALARGPHHRFGRPSASGGGSTRAMTPFEVFRAVQDHAANAAQAHMATVLLEALPDRRRGCEDEPLRRPLRLLCDLYALPELEADKGFFQEHGRLAGPRCKAITREVNRLCNEVRLQAGALVDAFGIPDAILGAPIALRDPDGG